MLYTWNKYDLMCQLYLNKKEPPPNFNAHIFLAGVQNDMCKAVRKEL